MFTAAKDALAGKSAQVFLNERIARYGRIERLRLDSQKKRIEVLCQLEGEPSPIEVTVEKYVVTTEGSKRYVEISRCACSRPWLENLLNDYAKGRRFEVPGWAAAAL